MKLNDIIKTIGIFLTRMDKTLWTGSFYQGNITVPDTDKYAAFRITLQNHDSIGFIDDSGNILIHNVVNVAQNNNQYIDSATIKVVGNVWTMVNKTEIVHVPMDNHTTAYVITITKIVGLLPKVGGGGA